MTQKALEKTVEAITLAASHSCYFEVTIVTDVAYDILFAKTTYYFKGLAKDSQFRTGDGFLSVETILRPNDLDDYGEIVMGREQHTVRIYAIEHIIQIDISYGV